MPPEVRTARITDAIGSHRRNKLSCVDAGELLGISERHFRRLRTRTRRGVEGLFDGAARAASAGGCALAVFNGPHWLATYRADGSPTES